METSKKTNLLKDSKTAPHSQLTEDQVMIRTLVAMCIPALAAVFAMGTQATYNILVAVLTALACHYILQYIDLQSPWRLGEPTYDTPYSPLVAGMIVGLCVGELSPYYVTAFISALTMVGFKWGQERLFGRKIINPAAGAKALVLLTLTALWMMPESLAIGQLFYPSHLRYALYTQEGFAGAMDLAEQVGFYGTENLNVSWSLILWKAHGWIGGASGVAVIVSGVLLAMWIKLKWRITVSFLAGMTVLAALMGVITGGDIMLRIAFHVFTGSVIFLAFYMATEPQTTPVTIKGQYSFGLVLALLTMVLKLWGLFGASFVALAILNPFVPYFDRVGIKKPFGEKLREYSPFHGTSATPDISSPVLTYNSSRCIACSQCIKACSEIQGKGVLDYGSRGRSIIVTAGLGERGFSECDGCGECVQICPTGAVQERRTTPPVRRWDADIKHSTCSHCGIGCQVNILCENGEIGKVLGRDAIPNYGSLCIKGRFDFTKVTPEDRITRPLLRQNDRLEPVSWQRAINEVAQGFSSVKEDYGADSVAGLSTADATNEDSYLFQKLMRAVIGTNNVDTLDRANHISTLTGLNAAFGYPAMTNSLEELRDADCILIPPNSNITQSNPVAAIIIKDAVDNHGTDLLVVDPRRTDLANWATIWLRPKYGTDVAWLNGMMNVILEQQMHDEEFIDGRTEGFSDFKEGLKDYQPEQVAKLTGLPAQQLVDAARIYAQADSASIVYSEHADGVDKVLAMTNLALMTGNVGKPAAGVNPLMSQNNLQGSVDMGVLPDSLPGYGDVSEQEEREKFASAWNRDVPANPGVDASEMFDEAAAGAIKAMLIMASDPAVSAPESARVASALESLDFLVVMDRQLTDTARQADVVLPLTTYAEEDGTFTSTERRISRVRKAVEPPRQVQPAWEILCALSAELDYPMNYQHPSEIIDEAAKLVPAYSGVSFSSIGDEGIQWPKVEESQNGTTYLYRDGFTRKRAKFHKVEFDEQQQNDQRYPLALSSSRMLFSDVPGSLSLNWREQQEFDFAEIHPDDAEELNILEGDNIQITTQTGELETTAKITDRVARGSVFLPLITQGAPPRFLLNNEDKSSLIRGAVPCRVDKLETISFGGATSVREASTN